MDSPSTSDLAVATAGRVSRRVVAGDIVTIFALGAVGVVGSLASLVAIIIGVFLAHGYTAAWAVHRWSRSAGLSRPVG